MNPPVLTFFSNKGGVGKTSLIYHLAWMFSTLGQRVLVADLDPQANLTAAFLEEDRIEDVWRAERMNSTVYRCLKPLLEVGDLLSPALQRISSNLHLLPGDVALSSFEATLAAEWPKSLADDNLYRPFRILTAFWHILQLGAESIEADIVLVDVGPNLGAINRSALLATDYVAIPLGADLFSLQGLSNLGPTLASWRRGWQKRRDNWKDSANARPALELPEGSMTPIGYLCQQYGVRLDRPVKAYDKWVKRIPNTYRETVLSEPPVDHLTPENDPYCLATIKHYRSLIPMGQEHRKPIFQLTSADGAIGAHANAVTDARKDFRTLALLIAERIGLPMHPERIMRFG